MAARKPLQYTLALLKPDICANPLLPPKIIDTIRARDLDVLAQKSLLWSQADAESFYGEHRGKFFFERLCGYMTRLVTAGFLLSRHVGGLAISQFFLNFGLHSGPFMALVLSSPNAIKDWRVLIGPTHPVRYVKK
jgi:nucleoside-diphosphate kinase